jgi:hypothetical protein
MGPPTQNSRMAVSAGFLAYVERRPFWLSLFACAPTCQRPELYQPRPRASNSANESRCVADGNVCLAAEPRPVV